MRNSKSEPNLKHSLQSKRLPCRGCTADCKNYAFVRVNHGDRINQVSKWGQKFINLKENPINLYDLLGSR